MRLIATLLVCFIVAGAGPAAACSYGSCNAHPERAPTTADGTFDGCSSNYGC